MATTVPVFRTRFPEFSEKEEYPDLRIQLFLDDAVTLYIGTDEGRWAGKYDIAHAYLSAHILKVATDSELGDVNNKAGPIASKSAGGVSVSRAVAAKDRSSTDEYFLATSYGQQYINIRNATFVGAFVAV